MVAFVPPLAPGRQDTNILTFGFFVVENYQRNGNSSARITGKFFDATNKNLPGEQFKGTTACDYSLGLPCGVKLLE